MMPEGIAKFLFTQLTLLTRHLNLTFGVKQLVENLNMPFMAFIEPARPLGNADYCFTLNNSSTYRVFRVE
jgi:hypothetical protein